jgi:hypothetical protein
MNLKVDFDYIGRRGRTRSMWLLSFLVLGSVLTSCAPLAQPTATGDSSSFERDRRAILAMTGEYEVRFDFRETVALAPGYETRQPYRSAGHERIDVATDEGRRIVLRHVLVTEDGHVTKHWTQVWTYEDPLLHEFRGARTWVPRRLAPGKVPGTWSQAVLQVDESPRYESFGRWEHFAGVAAWTSGETWRPLPRREHTKRSDYDVLVSVNRKEIVPSGWVHAQDSLKLALPSGEEPRALVREAGLNRYERFDGVDFGPARAYANETADFWALVRDTWEAALDDERAVRIEEKVGGTSLIEHLFVLAEETRGQPPSDATRAKVEDWIDRATHPVE